MLRSRGAQPGSQDGLHSSRDVLPVSPDDQPSSRGPVMDDTYTVTSEDLPDPPEEEPQSCARNLYDVFLQTADSDD